MLAGMISKDKIIVSESGIVNREDIEFVSKNGANAVLIGETRITSYNVCYTKLLRQAFH